MTDDLDELLEMERRLDRDIACLRRLLADTSDIPESLRADYIAICKAKLSALLEVKGATK